MKKIIIISLVVVLVLSVSIFAFADNNTPDWFKAMFDWRKDQIEKAVEDGTITKEQAEFYNERMDEMEKYHEENGFQMPFGGGKRFNGGQGRFNGGAGVGCPGPGGMFNNNQSSYQ